ncbi:MAG: hypothetical protein ACLP9Y_08310 [Mycobacterium sp.]
MIYQGSVSNYSIQVFPSTWTGPSGYTRVVALTVALSGGGGLALLNFIPAGRPVPAGSKRPGTTSPVVFDLFLPMDDYTAIVDLVRNETPINFFFDDTTLQIGVTTQGKQIAVTTQGGPPSNAGQSNRSRISSMERTPARLTL